MIRPVLALAVLGGAALAACTQKHPTAGLAPADVVAEVDGVKISRNTFNHYVQGVEGKPIEELTEKVRNELLDNLVRGQVVATAAETLGLAGQDEVRAVIELQRLNTLQQAVAEDYLKDRQASEEELRAEYDIQIARMDKVQYRASHILVPTEEAAGQILQQLKAGANFAQLARANSTDAESAGKGGDLDWFSPSAMSPSFAAAVRALKKGETSAAPVKTDSGWHVIRVTDTREALPPSFESVVGRLDRLVLAKKFDAYVEQLVAKAKITKTP